METPAVPALLIGAIFVEKGLITQEQLDAALDEQRRTGERLGEILVDLFGISRLDLASALADQWAEFERQGPGEPAAQQGSPVVVQQAFVVSDAASEAEAKPGAKRPIGEIFLERGMITEHDLSKALEEQQASGRRLGEILVAQGQLSRLELASALADQWASFQKLRPPEPTAEERASRESAPVLPTPEVVAVAPPTAGRPDLAALAARIAALETAGDVRHEIDAMHAEIGALAMAIEAAAGSGSVAELRAHLERVANAVEAQGRRLGAMPLQDGSWREDVARLAARVDELATTVQPAEPGEGHGAGGLGARLDDLAAELAAQGQTVAALAGWKDAIAALEQRVTELADADADAEASGLTELRSSLDDLSARIDGLGGPTVELERLVVELQDRLAAVEAMARADDELAGVRAELAALAGRVDELPVPSEEWRGQIAALSARLDGMPVPSEEWRSELAQVAESVRVRLDRVEASLADDAERAAVAELWARVDELAAGPPAGLEELRVALGDLAVRVDALPVPSEEWRGQIAALSARLDGIGENLLAELDRLANDVAARADHGAVADLSQRLDELAVQLPDGLGKLRAAVRQLGARVDALPVPTDEWRLELAQVAENLRVRIERTEGQLEQRPGFDTLAALRDEIQQLAARLDAEARRRDEQAEGLATRLDGLAERVASGEAAEERLHDALVPIVDAAVAPLRNDGDELRARLDEAVGRLDAADSLAGWRDGLDKALGGQENRLNELSRRIEELRAGPSAAEVAAALGGRLDASEAVAADGFSSLDERIAALGERLAESASQSGAVVESLRRELDDVRGVTAAAAASSAVHTDRLAETLRAEIAEAVAGIDQRDALERLAGLVEGQATMLDALQAGLRDTVQRSDEVNAGRTAELHTLHTRVEQVEMATAGVAHGWREATDEAAGRLEGLERLHAEQAEQLTALERAQAKRADVRELREALARVEQRLEREAAEEDARVRAVETALRDGLASLGSRLAETEGSYREAGDALRRSIERLGSAIRSADDHVSPAGDVSSPPVEATSFLAFAPTPEGYRLVECDGPPPELGGRVDVPDHEGSLRVTRLGASPLPFDGRACAYLEPAD